MMYIWWVMIVIGTVLLTAAVSLPISAGQRRLHACSRLCQLLSVTVITTACIQLYHPFVGMLISIAIICFVLFALHIKSVRKVIVSFIHPYAPRITRFVARVPLFEYVSDTRTLSDKVGVSSHDELRTIINGSPFMSEKDRHRVAEYIPFLQSTVADYMRPLDDIIAIQEDDVIGPLLLDELHSSGQHSFLVCSKLGAIRGTVKLTQLTESSTGISRVEDIMDRHVAYVLPSMNVQDACNTLVKEQVWLAVVRDGNKPSVLMLQDIVSALLGKKLR